ncbi:unnamed protein product [Ilex paraguariensis]|uniref:Uncharacterized protein n=1 Tax=Ilex paraguariensis TaxID=185542 RepID=A0ABC8SQQ8_9AQUA
MMNHDLETHSTAIPFEATAQSSSSGRNQWLQSIMDDGGNINATLSATPRIQKVPPALRMNTDNGKYYEPHLVSFGPYHHGKAELEPVEKSKATIVRQFVLGSGKPIDDFYNKVVELADNARNCYLEGSTDAFTHEEFAQMLFLDGCFILCVIECIAYGNVDLAKIIIGHLGLFTSSRVLAEMFLLENQLPFLVLWNLAKIKFQGDAGEQMIDSFIYHVTSTIPLSQSRSKIAQGQGRTILALRGIILIHSVQSWNSRQREFMSSLAALATSQASTSNQTTSLESLNFLLS